MDHHIHLWNDRYPKGVVLDYLANSKTAVLTSNLIRLKLILTGKTIFSLISLNHIAERIVVEYAVFVLGERFLLPKVSTLFCTESSRYTAHRIFCCTAYLDKIPNRNMAKLPTKNSINSFVFPSFLVFLNGNSKKPLA